MVFAIKLWAEKANLGAPPPIFKLHLHTEISQQPDTANSKQQKAISNLINWLQLELKECVLELMESFQLHQLNLPKLGRMAFFLNGDTFRFVDDIFIIVTCIDR